MNAAAEPPAAVFVWYGSANNALDIDGIAACGEFAVTGQPLFQIARHSHTGAGGRYIEHCKLDRIGFTDGSERRGQQTTFGVRDRIMLVLTAAFRACFRNGVIERETGRK